ncbi:hypothetical protein KCP73_15965 [Salmonella enterica subsp. enterica]|nr:hypothetical protein KCP73_15965 [Salmonella enterica subsp. enterica]
MSFERHWRQSTARSVGPRRRTNAGTEDNGKEFFVASPSHPPRTLHPRDLIRQHESTGAGRHRRIRPMNLTIAPRLPPS